MALDSQQKELIARAAFEAELIRRGFEVARANRDKGIDLIVFLDEPSKPFSARPIQLKASSGTRFGLQQQYAVTDGLILAYAWNILTAPRFFLLGYADAERLLPENAKKTRAWLEGRAYSWPKAPQAIEHGLKPHEDWVPWLRRELEKGWHRPAP